MAGRSLKFLLSVILIEINQKCSQISTKELSLHFTPGLLSSVSNLPPVCSVRFILTDMKSCLLYNPQYLWFDGKHALCSRLQGYAV